MVFCEAILDELKLNLCSSDNDSDAHAREILEGICRNRLALTTWLNKVRHRAPQPRSLVFLPSIQTVMREFDNDIFAAPCTLYVIRSLSLAASNTRG